MVHLVTDCTRIADIIASPCIPLVFLGVPQAMCGAVIYESFTIKYRSTPDPAPTKQSRSESPSGQPRNLIHPAQHGVHHPHPCHTPSNHQSPLAPRLISRIVFSVTLASPECLLCRVEARKSDDATRCGVYHITQRDCGPRTRRGVRGADCACVGDQYAARCTSSWCTFGRPWAAVSYIAHHIRTVSASEGSDTRSMNKRPRNEQNVTRPAIDRRVLWHTGACRIRASQSASFVVTAGA